MDCIRRLILQLFIDPPMAMDAAANIWNPKICKWDLQFTAATAEEEFCTNKRYQTILLWRRANIGFIPVMLAAATPHMLTLLQQEANHADTPRSIVLHQLLDCCLGLVTVASVAFLTYLPCT
eukprot:TRINITY_DN27734_c0_g1_i2.p1 TRINITY_DN27734_c0_g1~~TRINITY_DN27734_c0_g1_i2.p1  ORF type:complete len:122 (+),score=15.19 TRINITY_DN27734_c0_g1_i2:1-366(+)